MGFLETGEDEKSEIYYSGFYLAIYLNTGFGCDRIPYSKH